MTHDQAKPPESEQSGSPPPAASASETAAEVQEAAAVPPASSGEKPAANRETVAPAEPSPRGTTAGAATSASAKRSQAFSRLVRQLWGIGRAVLPILLELGKKLWRLTLALLKWLQQQWTAALPKIRPALPEPFKTKLPDRIVTATAIALLLLVLWITSSLVSPSSTSTARTQEPPPAVSAPVKPASPDPKRMVRIQAQLADVSDRYSEGLIEVIRANVRRSQLVVQVENRWYALDPALQTQLANELLKRSHKLKFDRLEITDRDGTLLARSPVVGSSMIVLPRQAPIEEDLPSVEEPSIEELGNPDASVQPG